MVEEIQKFTKITFIIHFVIGIILTVLFFIPEITVPIYGMTYTDEIGAILMILGASGAGLTVSSLCGFLAKEWKEVKIVIIAELVWLATGLIAAIINFAVFNIGMGVVTLIIFIVLLVLFVLTFLQQEEKMKPLL